MKVEINDVIIDSRVTTINVRVTPKPEARKKYHLDPFYSIDKYIAESGKITYTVFNMLGKIVKGKEADKILSLIKDKF